MFIDNILQGFTSVNLLSKASISDYESSFEELKRLARTKGADFNAAFIDRVYSQRRIGQLLHVLLMLGAIALALAFSDQNEFVAVLFPVAAIGIHIAIHWYVRIGKNNTID